MQDTSLSWIDRLQEGIQQATELADRFGVDGQLREQAASMLASRVGASQESLDVVMKDSGEPGSRDRLAAIAGLAANPNGLKPEAPTETPSANEAGQQEPAGEGSKLDLNSVRDAATTVASVASANPKVKVALWALQKVDFNQLGETLSGGPAANSADVSQKQEAAREVIAETEADPQAKQAVINEMRENPEFRRALMHEIGGIMNSTSPRMQHAAGLTASLNEAGGPREDSDQSHGPRPV